MKAELFVCMFVVMTFVACGGGAAEGNDGQEVDTVVVDEEEVTDDDDYYERPKDTEGGRVSVSEDGRVRIESNRYSDGGTSPDYWTKWSIVDSKGGKHEFMVEGSPFMSGVHSLRKRNGSTYYIVDCSGKSCSWEGYEWMEAYRIVGDTIKEVSVFDGGKGVTEHALEVVYSIPDWYYMTNGAGYDWMFEYDAKSGNLYVPLTDGYDMLDRYEVWHFDGDRFVSQGEQAHKDLNEEVREYNRLIRYFETKDYIVRVDSMASRELRYASWRRPKTMADKPDVVVMGGVREHHQNTKDGFEVDDDYHFRLGKYEYVVNYEVVVKREDGFGDCCHYLLVKRDGKVVLKQARE